MDADPLNLVQSRVRLHDFGVVRPPGEAEDGGAKGCDFSDMTAMLGQRLDAGRVDEGVLVFDPAKDLLSAKGDNVFPQARNKCVVPATVDEQAIS